MNTRTSCTTCGDTYEGGECMHCQSCGAEICFSCAESNAGICNTCYRDLQYYN